MSVFLLRFALNMQQELDRNDHKSGWGDMTQKEIINRIRQETGELARAVMNGKTKREIISECADIANFAMMLADNVRNGNYDAEVGG